MNPRTPLAAFAVAILALAALPHAAAENVDDRDGDRIPDAIDDVACQNGAFQTLINTAGQGAIWCDPTEGDVDYAASYSIFVVVNVYAPDGDGDGFPAEITFQREKWTFDPHASGGWQRQPAEPQTVGNPDPWDSDPQRPEQSTFQLPPDIIVNAAPGPDPDGDNLPTYVRIYKEKWTVDRRGPWTYPYASSYEDRQVDNDPNRHVAQDVIDLIAFVQPIVDPDGDFVPDAAEPTICSSVQLHNVPQDGECDASDQDYAPPGAADMTKSPDPDPNEVVDRVDKVVETVQDLAGQALPLVGLVKDKVGVVVHTDLLP